MSIVRDPSVPATFPTAPAPPVISTPPAQSLPSRALGQRLVLDSISWRDYELIGEALRDRGGIRLTFDRGSLEIMTTSHRHEWLKSRFGKLVERLADELEVPMEAAGQMTFKQEVKDRGFEPDECYWIQHEPQMRGKIDYDQDVDPPPDLTLEIEVTKSALDRMAIFAEFKVPEVWRYDGIAIHIHRLQSDGTYVEVETSAAFPGIPVQEIAQFLQADPNQSSLDLMQAFVAWIQKNRQNKP